VARRRYFFASLLLQQRLDFLFQFLERHRALEPLTIDEEGRR
jgi:hypothetical protein